MKLPSVTQRSIGNIIHAIAHERLANAVEPAESHDAVRQAAPVVGCVFDECGQWPHGLPVFSTWECQAEGAIAEMDPIHGSLAFWIRERVRRRVLRLSISSSLRQIQSLSLPGGVADFV